MRECWTEKFGPLVVTLSLEFSRLPVMLSPLKITLFPMPNTPAAVVQRKDTDQARIGWIFTLILLAVF